MNLRTNPLGAAYPVALPAFQGPLELLLQLIEKEELAISEVSLVAVTDSYLKTIAELEQADAAGMADFLTVASRLLYIKSRSLLPHPRPADDEEEDAGDALVRQLLAYQQFKQIAALLKARQESGLRSYVRTDTPTPAPKRLDLSSLDLAKLQAALRKVIQRIPNDPPMPTVKTYSITLSEQIEKVRRHIKMMITNAATLSNQESNPETATQTSLSFLFTELLSPERPTIEMVVTFLAILELIKQEEVIAEQAALFGEIVLTPLR